MSKIYPKEALARFALGERAEITAWSSEWWSYQDVAPPEKLRRVTQQYLDKSAGINTIKLDHISWSMSPKGSWETGIKGRLR